MSETAEHEGPLNPSQVRVLKIAVVVMAIFIVVGLLAVIARIIYLAGKPRTSPATVASGVSRVVERPRLSLPAGAAVRNLSLSGGRLAVHYDAPAGSGIAILDLETGTVVSQVEIVPQAPQR